MTYRVIEWATGQLGVNAVAGIAGHPDLELVGAWVHSEAKEGRDVGELCGLKELGVRTTRDKDALLALPADCVCYTAGHTIDWMQQGGEAILSDLERILRAGKNVVNVSWPPLVYPRALGPDIHERLQQACLDGGTSLFTAGIDPGYASLGLAMSTLSVVSEVRCLRIYEILNYDSWGQPEMVELFGFGQSDESKCALFTPGVNAAVWGSTLALLAEALGVELDEIVEEHQVLYADESFDVEKAGLHIAAGTISGARFQVKGLVGGEPRIVVDHVTRLRDEDYRELEFPGGGYRVEIEGEPCIKVDMALSSPHSDPGRAALFACSMSIVNAIPAVCDAAPGILTYRDLPPAPSRNVPRG